MSNENDFNNIRSIIENRARANWTETEIAYMDVPYKVKVGVDYIFLVILFGLSENYGLSSWLYGDHPVRRNGVLQIQCFSKNDDSTQRILEIAGKANVLYENHQENGLSLYAGSVLRIGEDGDFLRYDVEIDFYYQQ